MNLNRRGNEIRDGAQLTDEEISLVTGKVRSQVHHMFDLFFGTVTDAFIVSYESDPLQKHKQHSHGACAILAIGELRAKREKDLEVIITRNIDSLTFGNRDEDNAFCVACNCNFHVPNGSQE